MWRFAPLRLAELPDRLVLEGGTFRVEIDHHLGLMQGLELLGQPWLGPGMYVPDLWVSAAIDPRGNEFRARHAAGAQLQVTHRSDDRVVIAAEGGFARITGETFPMRWSIQYTFHRDGTCQLDVTTTALQALALRWAVLAAGAFRREVCPLLVVERDMAQGLRTCSPRVWELDREEPDAIAGSYIPWLQAGHDTAAVDVVFPESSEALWGWTDTSPYETGDPLGRAGETMRIIPERARLSWTRYALRNLHQWFQAGDALTTRFYLAFLPSKSEQPWYNHLSVYWEGPHQYTAGYRAPGPEVVATLKKAGVQLVIGGINWASGDYARAADAERSRTFIESCHENGIRVIPYVTFHDLEYGAGASVGGDATWRIVPVAEFNYRSHLMCTGAEGWREHWKSQIRLALEQFDVDGLYIDFWAGRLTCINGAHGCTGPHGRFNIAGLRELVAFARELLNQKRDEAIIVANTNILPLAMINNWIDVRLLGEWHNVEETEPKFLRAFYHPKRFRCNHLLLTGRVPRITARTVAMAVACDGSLTVRGRHHDRTRDELAVWDAYRQLMGDLVGSRPPDVSPFEARQILGLPEDVYASAWSTGDGVVVSLANLAKGAQRVPAGLLTRLMRVSEEEAGMVGAGGQVAGRASRVTGALEWWWRCSEGFSGARVVLTPGDELELAAGEWGVVRLSRGGEAGVVAIGEAQGSLSSSSRI